MKSPKSNLEVGGQRQFVMIYFYYYYFHCADSGAEDITILRDGLAFLSTVSYISAVSSMCLWFYIFR